MVVSFVLKNMVMPKYGAEEEDSEAEYLQKDGEEVIIFLRKEEPEDKEFLKLDLSNQEKDWNMFD